MVRKQNTLISLTYETDIIKKRIIERASIRILGKKSLDITSIKFCFISNPFSLNTISPLRECSQNIYLLICSVPQRPYYRSEGIFFLWEAPSLNSWNFWFHLKVFHAYTLRSDTCMHSEQIHVYAQSTYMYTLRAHTCIRSEHIPVYARSSYMYMLGAHNCIRSELILVYAQST